MGGGKGGEGRVAVSIEDSARKLRASPREVRYASNLGTACGVGLRLQGSTASGIPSLTLMVEVRIFHE